MLGAEFALEDLRSHPEIAVVIEDGATFAENARIKATAVSRQLPGLVLADDSGLEVDSLGGAPGVFSARYAGVEANDEANRQKLLVELAKRGPDAARMARFHCALALARDGRVLAICEGSVVGQIVRQARGSAGFGYDPAFLPDGHTRTFGEMTSIEKHGLPPLGLGLSHRARAFVKLAEICLDQR